ncbi:uncharacterized protein LOC133864953 [Alnus glutinosa]|uniref:uncharacterized protein LOC133864953 n=1 Tax=Alnus glutinosa TaxID=3517 RepID=UPI002D77DEE5|nr:uncharacterized protein LOC133864953 [Alnus glutinosa]
MYQASHQETTMLKRRDGKFKPRNQRKIKATLVNLRCLLYLLQLTIIVLRIPSLRHRQLLTPSVVTIILFFLRAKMNILCGSCTWVVSPLALQKMKFHYGVFFAYMRLREQEIRNLMWISECVAQNQKARVHDSVVFIF